MARILLSAYACEPGRGSEPAVGWNWAIELARQGHEVTVMTRAANRQAIAEEMSRRDVGFIYYDLPLWVQRLRSLPGGKRVYYVLWQWCAARMIRQRFRRLPFDLVQHVTYVSVRYPSFMGSLGIPFYFGPVSGGETVPVRLRRGCSAGERFRERLRDLSNRLVAFDPLMRRTFRRATRILVTPDTLRLLPRDIRHKATQTLAIGLPSGAPEQRRPDVRSTQLRLLYVGRLLEWKGVDIALRAVALARRQFPNLSLTILGEGPARTRLERLSRELNLGGSVHWAGWVPHSIVARYYQNSDTFLFPSLRDSGGMVVLEALAQGLPVLCTSLGGPGLIVNRSCGRAVVTTRRDREELARELGRAIVEIAADPDLLSLLSHGARLRARQYSFEQLVLSIHPSSIPSAVESPA
ncbi:MAG TPA: glycosyltransferase [Candidatus Bathyarchaeia archaeon]|nr:glycosyltransferase [Candidatus Bathyarchaeia archaeon]